MKALYAALAGALLVVSPAAHAKNLYIPIAGVAHGANGTLFRTDVRIFNPSATSTIDVSVHFQPAGMDGRNVPGRLVSVAPRQMAVINDVVTFLGYPSPAIGAIRLDSDTDRSYEFVADSRTYTDSPNPAAPGTYGQFIPALDPAGATTRLVVLHLSHSDDLARGYRSNAGIMNPGTEEAIVTARLYKSGGVLVSEGQPFTVPPRSVIHAPVPALSASGPLNVDDAYLTFESSQPVFAYGSVVDNRSGDQIFVPGAADLAD